MKLPGEDMSEWCEGRNDPPGDPGVQVMYWVIGVLDI